jgi:hypothetical protein
MKEFLCVTISLIIFVGIMIFLVYIQKENYNSFENKKNSQNDTLKKAGIIISNEYVWSNGSFERYYRFIIDDVHKIIYITNNSKKDFDEIPFSKIIGFEVLSDVIPADRLERVIMGGALYGPMGAMIGAHTAKDKVDYYTGVIYLNDPSKPRYNIHLINKKTSTSSGDFQRATSFMQNVGASINAIVSMNSSYNRNYPF